jgi:hypothetical protein
VPNFLSLRQNFTRSLDCFAGKLKSKNSQELDALLALLFPLVTPVTYIVSFL